MDPAKDSDEDSLVRIMARLNNKCQRQAQSYKLFKNDCKIPMPRPSIIKPIKLANNMAVSTPMTSKYYRENVSCSFNDMSSIAKTPTAEKTPLIEKNKTSAGKEKEASKNVTVITVNSSSSCHASSPLKTSKVMKQEPRSIQSHLGESNRSAKKTSFSPERSNGTPSVIEISSVSVRPENSNLSKSAPQNVSSQRNDSTYNIVDQSITTSRSQNKEKDATFSVPNRSTRQQLTATESKRDAAFDVLETTPKVSNRIKTNVSCRNCLGCSSHDGSTSNPNSRSRERILSPAKPSKSKSKIDTSDKAKKTKETNKRDASGTRENQTLRTDCVVSKREEPRNVTTLSHRISRSTSKINDIGIGIGASVNKTKNNGDLSRTRMKETVGTNSVISKKGESKSHAIGPRLSRSMSRIKDTSVDGSANETKNNREMSRSRKIETICTDSVVSKKRQVKNSVLSRKVSRSMSIINETNIGGSVNETKNSRETSKSKKIETICTNSVVSKEDTPNNSVLTRRVSRSMSRIDDISIGSSVHESRNKKNESKTRKNMTTFGEMDTTLTVDKPRFQTNFTNSRICEPSVEKANKRELSRPKRDATLKEISNVMVDDATFEKPRNISGIPNKQHKRKQSPSTTESFSGGASDEQGTKGKTKIQKIDHDRNTRREISVQVNDKSLSETVKSNITPRLTALGEIIPKVDALEKIVKYLAGKHPVTPQNRVSIPRRTICTQTGKSMEAQTSVACGSSEEKSKQSVGVGSDVIDNDEDDFFTATDVPQIVVSPKLIEYDGDNLPWRLRTPQAMPKRQNVKRKVQGAVPEDKNCPVKNIFDSLIESPNDESMTRSSPRKMYRPSAAATNRKVFINKRKTTMNKRRSTQESLRKSLLKKRSRISLKRPSLSSSSDVDEFQSNSFSVNVRTNELGNKKTTEPSKHSKRRLSVVDDFSDTGFSDKENSTGAASVTNSLAVKTPIVVNSAQSTIATNTPNQYVSKILSQSPMYQNTSTGRNKTKNGAIKEVVNTQAIPSPSVIRPPSPFDDSFKSSPEHLCQDEVSTSRNEISRKKATGSLAQLSLGSEESHQNPSIFRRGGKCKEDNFNEVSTTSELNKKNSSRSRVAKTTKQNSTKDQFDPDEPTLSGTTSKKMTNKKPLKKPPKRTRKISEDIREGSPTSSEVSTDLRRSSRQIRPPKRLNEVGFLNCVNDREYDNWLMSQSEKVFKVPVAPKTRRRRTTKKSLAATTATAKNKPRETTINRTIESSHVTNRMTECSQMTNITTECSQMTNRMTEYSQMTSFNGDMSETVPSRAETFVKRTKNDISSSNSKQNGTLQTMDFSTESDNFRIVSNNLQNLHFKSLKEDDNVSVAWTLASNSGRTTTGYLKLEPGALKPKQISAHHELSFLVYKGKAKIGVQDTTHVVSTTESFIVPKGSPTPSEVSTNLRRSSRQRQPPKRLYEVGFVNCINDREYDDMLRSGYGEVFKVPVVPKTRRRRTTKKSVAATTATAENKPRENTTNRTTNSSHMTNRTTECSQMTNRTTRCSQMTNKMTEYSQMTSFNGDMSETMPSRSGTFYKRTKNDISSFSSKQNDTLQTMDFSTESDYFRMFSNNLQNLHFESLKEDDNVSVAWTLTSDSGRTTTGYLKLEPGALKPKQISAHHELSFLVYKGKAKIGVQDTTHIVSTTQSFIVPKGMEYYIINVSKTEELLLMFHRFHLE